MTSGVVTLDPWLGPYKDALRSRFSKTQTWIKTIEESEGGLDKFSRVSGPIKFCGSTDLDQGFERFGFQVLPNNDVVYREWAPNASRAYLIGDFSTKLSRNVDTADPPADGWNRESHEMKRDDFGVFEITVPAVSGNPPIPHDSKIKVSIHPCAAITNDFRSQWWRRGFRSDWNDSRPGSHELHKSSRFRPFTTRASGTRRSRKSMYSRTHHHPNRLALAFMRHMLEFPLQNPRWLRTRNSRRMCCRESAIWDTT